MSTMFGEFSTENNRQLSFYQNGNENNFYASPRRRRRRRARSFELLNIRTRLGLYFSRIQLAGTAA